MTNPRRAEQTMAQPPKTVGDRMKPDPPALEQLARLLAPLVVPGGIIAIMMLSRRLGVCGFLRL